MNHEELLRTGGPAFPVEKSHDFPGISGMGMTMLDWFAGQALAGMLAYPGDDHKGSFHNNSSPDGTATYAYEYAAAMLAAKKAGG